LEGFFLLCPPLYYCLDLFEIIICDSLRFEGRVVGWSLNLATDSCCRHKFALFDRKHFVMQAENSFPLCFEI